MDINDIQTCLRNNKVKVSNHCMIRAEKRNISLKDVFGSIINGEIIEDYPDDYPFPSCLILSFTDENEPVHTVCALGNGLLYFVTVYIPTIDEWEPDFRTRKVALK